MNFAIPFSGWYKGLEFVNCFTSVYMYLEKVFWKTDNLTSCNEWENGQCNGCGNCATKPQALQEVYFFLFDTMCGHSSLRLRYDGTSTEIERTADGDSESSIEFLFGFTGYSYRTVTDPASFRSEIAASVSADKPVIAKLKENQVSFAVITGYEGDAVICPDFRCARKAPDPAVTYDNIAELYIIGEKGTPKYSLKDGLKRIEYVMGECLREDRWGGYMTKIGTYGPDSLGEDNTEGRKRRMKRLAETMWYTFNCHVFAQVFRTYRRDRPRFHPDLYDRVGDVNRLDDPAFNELIHTISWRYGYTHDLAWSLIGLEECINWDDWKSHYYGDMLEVIIMKLKENDEAVLECIREMIRICEA